MSRAEQAAERLAELSGATADELARGMREFDVRDIAAALAEGGGGGGGSQTVAIKTPCVVIADAEVALDGLETIDFYAVQEGDRVLVIGNGNANGIYVASAGPWVRAEDADAVGDIVSGTLVPISSNGAAYAGAIALLNPSSVPWTPDVDSMTMDVIAGLQLLYADSSMHNQETGQLGAVFGATGGAFNTGAYLVLPTADPGIVGALWNNAGTPAISAGPGP